MTSLPSSARTVGSVQSSVTKPVISHHAKSVPVVKGNRITQGFAPFQRRCCISSLCEILQTMVKFTLGSVLPPVGWGKCCLLRAVRRTKSQRLPNNTVSANKHSSPFILWEPIKTCLLRNKIGHRAGSSARRPRMLQTEEESPTHQGAASCLPITHRLLCSSDLEIKKRCGQECLYIINSVNESWHIRGPNKYSFRSCKWRIYCVL